MKGRFAISDIDITNGTASYKITYKGDGKLNNREHVEERVSRNPYSLLTTILGARLMHANRGLEQIPELAKDHYQTVEQLFRAAYNKGLDLVVKGFKPDPKPNAAAA